LPQPKQQNKTKKLGWCGIIIGKKKPPPPPHHTDVITFQATSRQPRKLTFGMHPYSNPSRRNLEEDLNIFENGRRPKFFSPKEDDLNFFENERQPQKQIMEPKTNKSNTNNIFEK
jgi:hypothetical protein